MVALGLVLLVVSGAVAGGVVLSNTDPVSASAFGVTLSDVTIGGLFLVGAATGLVFMLGLAMMLAGGARNRSKKVARKHQVSEVRTEKEQLEQENAELRARLDGDNARVPNSELGDSSPSNASVGGHAADPYPADTVDAEHKRGVFRR